MKNQTKEKDQKIQGKKKKKKKRRKKKVSSIDSKTKFVW